MLRGRNSFSLIPITLWLTTFLLLFVIGAAVDSHKDSITVAANKPLLLSQATAADNEHKQSKKTDAPYLKLPATLNVKPNRYFKLLADTNCASVKWVVPTGLDPLDLDLPIPRNAKILIGDNGTYVVQCYGALGDQATDIAACTVTVGNPPPPGPPGPTPGPASPLTAGFQAAYNLDTDSDKARSLLFLQGAYAGMASDAKNWSTVKTVADALAEMKAVIQAPSVGLSATQVQNLRKAIGAELTKTFGNIPTTAITLLVLSTELQAIADGLKGVK